MMYSATLQSTWVLGMAADPLGVDVSGLEEEEEGFYKFLPANTADRLCQSWQSCSIHHEI